MNFVAPLQKKGKNEEESEEEVEDDEDQEEMDPLLVLQPEVARRVRKLRAMHNDYETLHGEYKAERIALERKFLARKEELFAKRKAIVTGEEDVETTPEGELYYITPYAWVSLCLHNFLLLGLNSSLQPLIDERF